MLKSGAKVIAVCSAGINSDYNDSLWGAFHSLANLFDFKILFFNSFSDLYSYEKHDIGESNIFQLMNYEILDGVIILSETIKYKKVCYDIIEKANAYNIPVVSMDATLDGCYSVNFEYAHAMEEIIEHLINVHHYTKINFIAGIKDGHIVAPACQQHRNGQARRARADDGGFHPVPGGGAGRHLVGIGGGDIILDDGKVHGVVAGHPVADAVALALVLVVADQAADGGQGVVFKQHPAGVVQLVVFQQPDHLGDIGVDGAALLTHRLFAAEAAVGFVQNVKRHEVPPLPWVAGHTLLYPRISFLYDTPDTKKDTIA